MRARQLTLPSLEKLEEKKFGGSTLRGNPREARPIAVKRPMHLVMRSSLAKGYRSFLHPDRVKRVEKIVHKAAKRNGVQIRRYANAGNHLHLLIQAPSRPAYRAFIRVISGLLARTMMATERGAPMPADVSFWDARPFTRVVEWGRDYVGVCRYLVQNTLEAIGFIAYQPRGRKKSRSGIARAGPLP